MTNHLVLGYGRFNPPTQGHQRVADLIAATAKAYGADGILCATRSRDMKNPLHGTEKLSFLQRAFPEVYCVLATDKMKTIFHTLRYYNQTLNYNRLTLVVGQDRVDDFRALLNKYNGKDFTFTEWEILSAGIRDDYALSATWLRERAGVGDFEVFREGLPDLLRDDLDVATQVYELTRKGLGL